MNNICKKIIKNVFPKGKCQKLGEGNHCIVFEVDNNFVIKISKNSEANIGLQNEANVLNLIKDKISIDVPKLIKIDYMEFNDKRIYYMVCTKVNGKHLTHKQYNKLNEEYKKNIAGDVAKFLKELHDIASDKYIKEIHYEKQLQEMKKIISNNYFDKFDYDTQKTIISYIDSQMQYFNNLEKRTSIIHNDLSCENMLFENNKFVGVIDFGDSGYGDVDNDFLCLCEESNEEFGLNFGKMVLNLYNHNDIENVIKKTKLKNEIWPLEKLYFGYLYNNRKMINEAIKQIRKQFSLI